MFYMLYPSGTYLLILPHKEKTREGFRNFEICQRNEQSYGKRRQIICEATTEVIGNRERCKSGIWYDEECKQITAKKKVYYRKMVQ
jgi:hypothetical protein